MHAFLQFCRVLPRVLAIANCGIRMLQNPVIASRNVMFSNLRHIFRMPFTVPEFDDLPTVDGMPQGCAWGVFDQDGKKDLRGTLNLLTPDVVAAACKEARDGVSISLKCVVSAFCISSRSMSTNQN
jgi:hypothetical protein